MPAIAKFIGGLANLRLVDFVISGLNNSEMRHLWSCSVVELFPQLQRCRSCEGYVLTCSNSCGQRLRIFCSFAPVSCTRCGGTSCTRCGGISCMCQNCEREQVFCNSCEENIKCTDCHEVICPDCDEDVSECGTFHAVLCGDCNSVQGCNNCNRLECSTCAPEDRPMCPKCDSALCASCNSVRVCDKCNAGFCSDREETQYTCAGCGLTMCKNCQQDHRWSSQECSKCGKFFCWDSRSLSACGISLLSLKVHLQGVLLFCKPTFLFLQR